MIAIDPRTDWHLSNWSNWQCAYRVKLGYSPHASGQIGVSGSSDFDSMCDQADAKDAAAVDAIIDELPSKEKMTVYNEWLATVFRFEGDPETLYAAAVDKIKRGMAIRGMW